MPTLSQYQDQVSQRQSQLNRLGHISYLIGSAMDSARRYDGGPFTEALLNRIDPVLTKYGLMESFPQLPQEICTELTKVLAEEDVIYRYNYESEAATAAAWRALGKYGDELMSDQWVATLREAFTVPEMGKDSDDDGIEFSITDL